MLWRVVHWKRGGRGDLHSIIAVAEDRSFGAATAWPVRDDGDLKRQADSKTGECLVTDPLGGRGVCGERVQQDGADGASDGADDHEGDEVTVCGDETARCDGRDRRAEDERQVADTALRS